MGRGVPGPPGSYFAIQLKALNSISGIISTSYGFLYTHCQPSFLLHELPQRTIITSLASCWPHSGLLSEPCALASQPIRLVFLIEAHKQSRKQAGTECSGLMIPATDGHLGLLFRPVG